MPMDPTLAAQYGNDEQAKIAAEAAQVNEENFVKVANALDLKGESDETINAVFAAWNDYVKVASENGINLGQYTVEGVAQGFAKWAQAHDNVAPAQETQVFEAANTFVSKLASEARSEEEDFQRGHAMGKIAAHSFMAELRKEAAGDGPAGQSVSEAVRAAEAKAKETRDAAAAAEQKPGWMRSKYEAGKAYASGKADVAGKALKDTFGDGNANKWRNRGLAAGGALALAGGAYGAKKLHDHYKGDREKEAFDLLAAKEAMAFLMSNGVEEKVAEGRIGHAYRQTVLEPVSEDVKTASAQGGGNDALAVRAYELVLAAGYSVGD